MKRMIALVLSMTMLLGLMVPVQAVEAQTDWEKAGFLSEPAALPPVAEAGKLLASVGEPEERAQPISTVEEFLAAKSGSWYLKNDLDLSAVTSTISLTKTLTIDGQGHKLTGLSVTLYQDYFYGVDLTLKNLLVETADEGVNGSAVLVGNWRGNLQIENCTVSGRLTGNGGSEVGGLATSVPKDGKLVNCAFFGNITVAESGTYVGGLVCSSGADIFNCVFDGTINGGTDVGGITSGSSGAIRSCRAEGSIDSLYSAGVVCYGVNGEVVDCIASVDGAGCGLVGNGKAVNCVVTDADLKGSGIGGNATGCAVYNSTCVGGGISTSGDVIRDCLVENCTITGTADVGGIAYGISLVSGCAVRNCTITAVGEDGVAGGIVGNADYGIFEGQPGIYDCVVEDTVITGYAVAGGIAGKGVSTLINCSVKGGSVTATRGLDDYLRLEFGVAGGILGETSYKEVAILSCDTDTTVSGCVAGGIAGHVDTDDAIIQGCHSSGVVTGEHLIGGILGRGSGIIRNCTSDASVTVYADPDVIADRYENINAAAGGIAGLFFGDVEDEVGGTDYETSARNFAFGAVMENCVFSGSVVCVDDNERNITSVGGLVGEGVCVIRDSVFRGKLNGGADDIGGILGRASYYSVTDGTEVSLIRNCQVTQPEGSTLHITAKKHAGFGGVLGENTTGSTAFIYHTDINCDILIDGRVGRVGGLSACSSYAEHCDINGDISIYSADTVSVGGFGGWIFGSFADCHINGKITVTAPEEVVENEGEENETSYSSTVGLIATGSNYEGKTNGYYYQSGLGPEGEMTWNGAPVTEMHSVEKDEWTFDTFEEDGLKVNFFVQGGYYDSGETFPLNGAKITVGNVTGYTDSTGMAALELEESAFQSAVEVRIQREGYDDFVDLHAFATNQDYSATLWKLDPGKIFITGGTVRLSEYVTRDIFGAAKTFILQDDEKAYPVSVNINWNGHEPERVLLYGEESGKTVNLTINGSTASGNVVFGGKGSGFAPEEMIRLYAVADTEEYGTLTAKRLTSVSVKELEIGMNLTDSNEQTVSDPEDGDKFFLEGSKVQLDFGNVGKLAGSVTLSNGILTVTYGGKDGEKKTGDLFTLDDAYQKDQVSLSGSISIPYEAMLSQDPEVKEQAKWSGEVKVALNTTTGFSDNAADAMKDMIQGVETDAPIHEDIWDFTVAGVPCYVKASVQVYAGATLKAYGNAEKLAVSGTLNGGASGSVGAGVGGAVGEDVLKINGKPALEVLAGLYGKVDGKFSVTMEAVPKGLYDMETNFTMKPVVSGEVGGEVVVHVFFVELKETLKLGTFTWDDTGIEWVLAGEEGEIKSLSLGETEEEWALLGRDYTEKLMLLEESDPNVFLPNVIRSAETAGNGSLFFATTEDMEVADQRNAMKLTVYQGNYANATVLDNTATSDHSPHADGEYITWIDVAEQSGEDGLASFLEDGRVAVVRGEDPYGTYRYPEKTLLTQPKSGVRVYHPVVATMYDNTTVAWLESPLYDNESKLTLMPETTEIWYSTTADGSEWTEPVKLTTITGSVDELYPAEDGASVSYRIGSTLYTVSTADQTVTEQADRHWYTVNGNYAAWVQDDQICYQKGNYVYSCGYTGVLTQGPIYNGSYVYYVTGNQIWKADSRETSLVAEVAGTIRELQVVGNRLLYLADVDGTTNLYRHEPNVRSTILSLRQEYGALEVSFRGSNRWEILQEEEVLVDSNTKNGVSQSNENGITTVTVDASLLPAGEELTFQTYSRQQTFTVKEPTPAIRDALITADTLQAYLLAYSECTPAFVLENWATGEQVAAWNGTDKTIRGLQYQMIYDVSGLPDGYYNLTVTCGTQSATTVVSKGDPMAAAVEVEIRSSETADGETTIRLMDSGKQLSGSVLVLAARYEKGQMKESTFGTAEGGEGIWDLILPEQVTEGWKLFLLDSTTKAPLCEPIVVQ